jgi:hypothetical protein
LNFQQDNPYDIVCTLKFDSRFVEDTFALLFPLPVEEGEAERDPELELQLLTNLFLVGAEDTRTPWALIAGEARAGEAGVVGKLSFVI